MCVDGRWWCADTGYTSWYGIVRMYWRTANARTLEVQVQVYELDMMARWAVRFLAGETDWASPPCPVTEELAHFGRECRYVWTAEAIQAYDLTRGLPHPSSLKGKGTA